MGSFKRFIIVVCSQRISQDIGGKLIDNGLHKAQIERFIICAARESSLNVSAVFFQTLNGDHPVLR